MEESNIDKEGNRKDEILPDKYLHQVTLSLQRLNPPAIRYSSASASLYSRVALSSSNCLILVGLLSLILNLVTCWKFQRLYLRSDFLKKTSSNILKIHFDL